MTIILRPGTRVSGYEIDDVLGVGGMAVVYRATQLSLDRMVALKVLMPRLGRDSEFRERFRREAKIAASLEHPNLVPIYETGELEGGLFIAMRLIDGPTLADRLWEIGLSGAESINTLGQIAEALDVAHDAGLVHRDVKPQNILLTQSGHPFLADFGVAKALLQSAGLTRTGGFVGSAHYAAPEQITGRAPSGASDVYALTVVLFQCLTGEVPFPRETDAGVLHAHLHEPPPSLGNIQDGDVPAGVDAVLARGLAKDPADRYSRASDLVADLRTAIKTLGDERLNATPLFPWSPAGSARPLARETMIDAAPEPVEPFREPTEVLRPRSAADRTSLDRRRESREATPVASRSPRRRRIPKIDRSRLKVPALKRPRVRAPRLLLAGLKSVGPKLAALKPAGLKLARLKPAGLTIARLRSSRFAQLLPGIVGLAVVVAVGYILGNQLKTKDVVRLDVGDLRVTLGYRWHPISDVADISGLPLQPSAGLKSADLPSLSVRVGRLATPGPAYDPLPNTLRARLASPIISTPVVVGGMQGFAYGGRLRDGSRVARVIMVATASGYDVIACLAPSSSAGRATGACDTLAAHVTVADERPVSVFPRAAVARALSDALRQLTAAISGSQGDLASQAHSRRGRGASAIAKGYQTAAQAVGRIRNAGVAQPLVDEVARQLSSTGSTFRTLASAARGNKFAAYRVAHDSVADAARELRSAVAAFRRAGYPVALPER